MGGIIRSYEVEEDGIIYVVEEWADGGVAKYIKPEPEPVPNPDIISSEIQAQLEMQSNIEYLVALTELNMEV